MKEHDYIQKIFKFLYIQGIVIMLSAITICFIWALLILIAIQLKDA